MKLRFLYLALILVGISVRAHADVIWHGDPNYSHFSITTADDVVLRIEGDTFSINSSIFLVGGGGGPVGYHTSVNHLFVLNPDEGWEFTSFNGSATDRGSYRNSPVFGSYSLDTQISLGIPGLAWTNNIYNPNWGSGGSFTITWFTPAYETYPITGSAMDGLTVTLDQQLYVSNDGYFGTDVGFGFSLRQSPVGSSVPDGSSTLALIGMAFVGLVGGRRRLGSVHGIG